MISFRFYTITTVERNWTTFHMVASGSFFHCLLLLLLLLCVFASGEGERKKERKRERNKQRKRVNVTKSLLRNTDLISLSQFSVLLSSPFEGRGLILLHHFHETTFLMRMEPDERVRARRREGTSSFFFFLSWRRRKEKERKRGEKENDYIYLMMPLSEWMYRLLHFPPLSFVVDKH